MVRSILLAASLWSAFLLSAHPSTVSYRTEDNVPYRGENSPERCRLTLYFPTDLKDFPTVVWFHGGGLKDGERFVPEELKNQGLAIVAPGYRLSPSVKCPVYIEDAAAAVAWTMKNIGKYGGNPKRVFVSGHSAGGYLTSMIGLDKRWLAAFGEDPDRLAGLVPYSGQAITHFTIREERGIKNTVPIIDDLAPLYHVRKDAPPILILSGDRNQELLGRYEETAYFWRMLKLVGHPNAEILELQGFDHGTMQKPAHELLLAFVRKIFPNPKTPAKKET